MHMPRKGGNIFENNKEPIKERNNTELVKERNGIEKEPCERTRRSLRKNLVNNRSIGFGVSNPLLGLI
jgi:hypothetical protein